jgi:hypothetical protein
LYCTLTFIYCTVPVPHPKHHVYFVLTYVLHFVTHCNILCAVTCLP